MYSILKPIIRLALLFYTKKVSVLFEKKSTFSKPKIIACNHPNSFFDAIIIAIFYPKPIYFLARGDAFKKPVVAKFLRRIHLIPIYRISEGISNLAKNTDTFNECISLLKNGETILIFSEGLCVQEWKLRSLKKGTARLALMAINEGVENLKIQPTNINYDSFTKVPKQIIVHFNEEFEATSINHTKEAEFYALFNSILKAGMEKDLIAKENLAVLNINNSEKSRLKKIIFIIPSFIGWFTQKWFYNSIKKLVIKKTKNSVFYDSILFGLLLLTYPLFVLLFSIVIGLFFGIQIGIISFILLPIFAYCYKIYKTI